MLLNHAKQVITDVESKLYALNHAMVILNQDGSTAAPKKSARGRGEAMAVLSGYSYEVLVDPETKEAIDTVLSSAENCEEDLVTRCRQLAKQYKETTCIPMDEYTEYSKLVSDADAAWHEAKQLNDYPMFKPYLTKLVEAQKKQAGYLDSSKPAYDVLLDKYEHGMNTVTLDSFFATLRERLTPVILAVGQKPEPDVSFLRKVYPKAQQEVFSQRLMAMLGMDPDCSAIAETEHPFTNSANKWDVRITTKYHENDVTHSMYSVIHEGGHALYELDIDDKYQFTSLAGGCCMSLHESQSRFYENIIGRSKAFCHWLLPTMQECFPEQMKGITEEQLYAGVNFAKPTLIRTEADELTYPMHVMIRYEIEKMMFDGQVNMDELPGIWNEMYKKYLGIDVPNDREGVLQDCHWGTGLYGYFPSYALGSAYGVQMLKKMEKEIDVWKPVSQGNMLPVTEWLTEHVHRYGCSKTPAEILDIALGGSFDPTAYTDYLTKKYSELYKL